MSKWASGAPRAAIENWGDQNGDEDEKVSAEPRIHSYVSGPDKEGIKTITEYRTEGKKIITTTRKVKETIVKTRVHKAVLARREWKKFGMCKGSAPGPEPNVTYSNKNENIQLQLKCKKREEEETDEADDPLNKLKDQASVVACRNCGEFGHWTLKCPNRAQIVPETKVRPNEQPGDRDSGRGGAWVGKSSQNRGAGESVGGMDEIVEVRVSNLNEDTTENDLRILCQPFGKTKRIYLAKDKITQIPRGFAFVEFVNRNEAKRAIERLNGHGYGNLILKVEMAAAREAPKEKDVGAQGAGRPGWTMQGTR